jgi:multicomponent Na+:H+ antiporter subunit A
MWLGPMTLGVSGLALGALPWLASPLVGAAASAMLGTRVPASLALWHGIEGEAGLILALSVATFALGFGFYLAHRAFVATDAHLGWLYAHGPERWYARALDGMLRVAGWQTRLLQSGYLRYYILTVVLATLATAGWVMATRVGLPPVAFTEVRSYEVIILLMMIASAGVVTRTDSRMTAIITLGVVGYGVALLFLLYGAPDLALTQFAIETLSVVMFVLVLYRLPRFQTVSPASAKLRDAAVALSLGGLMTAIVLAMTPEPLMSRLSTFFAEASLPQAYGRNVVNVILVDFRGLDTMGEITVLAVAALGVFALLKLKPGGDGASRP